MEVEGWVAAGGVFGSLVSCCCSGEGSSSSLGRRAASGTSSAIFL